MKNMIIGIENFKEMIEDNVYYVDKTHLIEDMFSNKVTLYIRPRRFGKTLNMSMLYYFFSNKEDSREFFKGLKITENKEMMKHMNQYPTIFITLKDMKRDHIEGYRKELSYIISLVMGKNIELLTSPYLDESERELMKSYRTRKSDLNEIEKALSDISRCLYLHYHKKVIILIDEYDVPLNYAYEKGYYDETVEFISGVFFGTKNQ